MKRVVIATLILFMVAVISSCGGSSSSSEISASEALSNCRSDVEIAVHSSASSNDAIVYKSGEKALEQCMARYGHYPK